MWINPCVFQVDYVYYQVSYFKEDDFDDNWVDLDSENATEISFSLSSSHKLAAVCKYSFMSRSQKIWNLLLFMW